MSDAAYNAAADRPLPAPAQPERRSIPANDPDAPRFAAE